LIRDAGRQAVHLRLANHAPRGQIDCGEGVVELVLAERRLAGRRSDARCPAAWVSKVNSSQTEGRGEVALLVVYCAHSFLRSKEPARFLLETVLHLAIRVSIVFSESASLLVSRCGVLQVWLPLEKRGSIPREQDRACVVRCVVIIASKSPVSPHFRRRFHADISLCPGVLHVVSTVSRRRGGLRCGGPVGERCRCGGVLINVSR